MIVPLENFSTESYMGLKDPLPRTAPRCPCCGFTFMEKPMPQGLNPLRITKLLSSNDAPTGTERAILKTVALKGAEYLSVLQQRISSTRETLYALLEEQFRQIKGVEDAKELLNPIRRLPEVVLLKIFTACIPNRIEEMIYASLGECDSLDTKNVPWVLSQVCASWRRTTLANPRLWSSISLVMDKYTNHMGYIFRFSILLARTKTYPLMVCIDANADIALHPLLAMVLPTSSRWSNLSVTAPLRSFLPFNNISHALPLLQFLDIRVTGNDSSEGGLESTRIVHGFQHAPNLCRLNLDLNSQELHPFSRWLVLPMDSYKLSRLNAFTTPSDAASLLNWHGAKNAKEFCLAMINYPPQLQQHVEVPIIRHSLLQNLSVTESASESTPGSIAELVSHLRLPALQKLTLIYKDSSIFLPAIDQHTAPPLTDLEILSDPPTTLDENSVIEMLRWTPRLRHLELAVKFTTPNVFIALGDVEDGAFKLIHFLETISLMGAQFQFDDYGRVITDMVEARFSAEDEDEAGPFFEEIYLDEEVGDEERWEKLCHSGLNVFVTAS